MRETRRLYYEDPALSRAEAVVIEARPGPDWVELALDSTIFYPEGGGQPCDLGTIAGLKLDSVREEDGRIFHRLPEGAAFRPGERVVLVLDRGRRRDHTQQHSGQHLLSAVLEREFGVHTISFHLGAEASTIDVGLREADQGTLDRLEALAEDFIERGHPFRVHVCPPEDLSSFALRRKPPQGEEEIRVVEIEGYDWVACCGTHVSSCAELRTLKLLSAERYKGNTRLSFVAGDRAVSLLRSRTEALKRAAGLLGCSPEDVPEKIRALDAGASATKAELGSLLRSRAALELRLALDARRGTSPVSAASVEGGPRATDCLSFAYDDRTAEAGFETAKAAAAQGLPAVVLTRKDRTVSAIVPAPPKASGQEPLGRRLGALLPGQGAKGGGGPSNFRASFDHLSDAESFAAAAVKTLSRS